MSRSNFASGFTTLIVLIFGASCDKTLADGPADNIPDKVRPVPRIGIEVPQEDSTRLNKGLSDLQTSIQELAKSESAFIKAHLPDVIIYSRAVHDALKYREFFHPRELKSAYELLQTGKSRAEALRKQTAPWARQTGLVVRGFRSRLDGTVQPYGLVIPESYNFEESRRHRLDIWFHGRGETLSEVNFITQRSKNPGQYTPPNTFVLHPYGRYSNAFKFAGEVDVLEGLAAVRSAYRIDSSRTSVRGFSMGGAACWQFAVHYADRWFAANPGAGFSETPEFLKFFQKQKLNPTWFERKLWHWYDCPDWALNLVHCPTVAYSGELDIQKQAADIMETKMDELGMRLVHIIGPQTKHRIHADSKKQIENKMRQLAFRGRRSLPQHVQFTTYTLKYPRMYWVTVTALDEHWAKATVDAQVREGNKLLIQTKNIAGLSLSFPSGASPFRANMPVEITINGQLIAAKTSWSDLSWNAQLHRQGDEWRLGRVRSKRARKRPGLQGPIDDAFMNSFLFVEATGNSENAAVDLWQKSELKRAIKEWRRHFRGYARVKKDVEVTEDDLKEHNIVLWGDPQSNQLLTKISGRLPIKWSDNQVTVGPKSYDAEHHALISISPNPLNPRRYVVLNSSFTFREFAYLNNARQVPMLPDWAVVDVRTPPSTIWPGKIVDAGFFDEQWRWKSR